MATYEMQRNPNISFTPNTNAPPGQMGTPDLLGKTGKTIQPEFAPSIGTNMGSVNATIAGILNQANAIQTQINEMSNMAKEQQAQASKSQPLDKKSGVWDQIQGLIGQRQEATVNQKSTEDIVNESMAKFGLIPETYQAMQGMIGQLTAYSTQMANLETQKQNAMNVIGDKAVDERYITQEQAVVAKRYDSQIASVSAQAGTVAYTLQLQQGLVKDAKETAGMVISAMTHDQEQKLKDMDWAISTYSDLYDAMGKEEQQQWDNAYKQSEFEYQMALDKANLQLEQLKLSQTGTGGASLDVDAWVDYLSTGQATMTQVPFASRDAVAKRAAERGVNLIPYGAEGQMVSSVTGLPVKLNESQVTDFQRYDQYLNDLIPTVSTLLNPDSATKVNTGGLSGRYMKTVQNLPLIQRTLSPEQNTLLATIALMNNQLIYMLSGKQINEGEYKRLLEQMPNVTLTNEQNMIRINMFNKIMSQAKNSKMKLMGLTTGTATSGTTGGNYNDYLKAIQ